MPKPKNYSLKKYQKFHGIVAQKLLPSQHVSFIGLCVVYIVLLILLYCFIFECVKNSKTHKKYKISKSLIICIVYITCFVWLWHHTFYAKAKGLFLKEILKISSHCCSKIASVLACFFYRSLGCLPCFVDLTLLFYFLVCQKFINP